MPAKGAPSLRPGWLSFADALGKAAANSGSRGAKAWKSAALGLARAGPPPPRLLSGSLGEPRPGLPLPPSSRPAARGACGCRRGGGGEWRSSARTLRFPTPCSAFSTRCGQGRVSEDPPMKASLTPRPCMCTKSKQWRCRGVRVAGTRSKDPRAPLGAAWKPLGRSAGLGGPHSGPSGSVSASRTCSGPRCGPASPRVRTALGL